MVKKDVPVRTYLKLETYEELQAYGREIDPAAAFGEPPNNSKTVRLIIERFLNNRRGHEGG